MAETESKYNFFKSQNRIRDSNLSSLSHHESASQSYDDMNADIQDDDHGGDPKPLINSI